MSSITIFIMFRHHQHFPSNANISYQKATFYMPRTYYSLRPVYCTPSMPLCFSKGNSSIRPPGWRIVLKFQHIRFYHSRVNHITITYFPEQLRWGNTRLPILYHLSTQCITEYLQEKYCSYDIDLRQFPIRTD